ncbi:unnamed protein product [Heligmosomoides polygyrus]|uniref:Uncharacterized protein n=1 Tax=Heligmosomoides polygyrus TaxID=6339 RepID=A0A183G0J2_HELPZ|nr:unnamed protein product [Heligmosomoides polygyrus]
MRSLNTKANAKAASTASATRGSRSGGAAVSRTSKASEHIVEKKSDVKSETDAENESPEKIEEAEPLRCFDDYAASEERRRRMWVFAIIPGHERSLGGPSFYPRLADEPASVLASSPDSCSFSYFC